MFRDGQYLEVIKASGNYLATAVVTVQEKTIKIKEKNVSTNKWLDLEDWAALYKILEKAILRNVRTGGPLQDFKKCKWKKSTRQLDVTYMFEQSDSTKEVSSLPTIRVNVSPAKRKSKKSEALKTVLKEQEICDQSIKEAIEKLSSYTYQKDSSSNSNKSRKYDSLTKLSIDTTSDRIKRYLPIENSEKSMFEEYVPDTPMTKKLCSNLNYIPSRKSTLEQIQLLSDEYCPILSDNKSVAEVVRYIPNSVDSSKIFFETYEPSGVTVLNHPEEYVPNSKGIKASVEEYHPDFTSKSMKFDNSYVPSSVQLTNESAKQLAEGHRKLRLEKSMTRQKEISMK